MAAAFKWETSAATFSLRPRGGRLDDTRREADSFIVFPSAYVVSGAKDFGVFEVQQSSSTDFVSKTVVPTKCSKKQVRRDPNRPRGYISAFNFFAVENRARVLRSQPNLTVSHLFHNGQLFLAWWN